MKNSTIWALCGVGLITALLVSTCAPPKPKQDWKAEALYEYAHKKLETKNWLDALEAFRMITLNHSGSDLVDDALYYGGITHQKLDEHPMAVVMFRRILRDFPQSPYADKSQFGLAQSIYEQSSPVQLTQDKTFEAIRELQIFLDDYPDSDLVPQVNDLLQTATNKIAEKDYKIGHLYFKLHDYEAARLYLTEMVEEFPTSNWAPYAHFEIAESYDRQKNWEEATQRYALFLESYPGHELTEKARKRMMEIQSAYAQGVKKQNDASDSTKTAGKAAADRKAPVSGATGP